MGRSRGKLRSVSGSLAKTFEDGDVPTEEQMRCFMHEVADAIIDNDMESEITPNLAWLVETFYNYSDFDSGQEAFFYRAACWAAVNIYRNAQGRIMESHGKKADKLDIFQLEPDVTVRTTVAELLDLYHKGFSYGAGEYQKDVTVRGEVI